MYTGCPAVLAYGQLIVLHGCSLAVAEVDQQEAALNQARVEIVTLDRENHVRKVKYEAECKKVGHS